MTTAHKATWKAALGAHNNGNHMIPSTAVCERDSVTNSKLKLRGDLTIDDDEIKETIPKFMDNIDNSDNVDTPNNTDTTNIDIENLNVEEAYSDSDDDSEDEEELLLEIEKIKQERLAKKEEIAINDANDFVKEIKKDSIVKTEDDLPNSNYRPNPLIDETRSRRNFSTSDRPGWLDDTIFRRKTKRKINDSSLDLKSTRSLHNNVLETREHRDFMQDYIR